MKTSMKQAGTSRPGISKIVLALAVAAVMGAMATTPALAKDNHQGRHDNGLHKGQWKNDRDRNDWRPAYQPAYRQAYPQSYYYAEPVYVPPPVYYAPQQSPGVSIFLPLNIRF
jgi:hypothetical protein